MCNILYLIAKLKLNNISYQDMFRLEKIEKKKGTAAENIFKAVYVHSLYDGHVIQR